MQFLKLTAEANLDLLTLFMLRCACYVGKCVPYNEMSICDVSSHLIYNSAITCKQSKQSFRVF